MIFSTPSHTIQKKKKKKKKKEKKEESCIHTFPKSFSAPWNPNSLVQNLNLGRHDYFR